VASDPMVQFDAWFKEAVAGQVGGRTLVPAEAKPRRRRWVVNEARASPRMLAEPGCCRPLQVSEEPNAIAVATADAAGRPSVRMVLLKVGRAAAAWAMRQRQQLTAHCLGVVCGSWCGGCGHAGVPGPSVMPQLRPLHAQGYDERGFVFYTNYNSRKGQQLADNGNAAFTIFWEKLQRSVSGHRCGVGNQPAVRRVTAGSVWALPARRAATGAQQVPAAACWHQQAAACVWVGRVTKRLITARRTSAARQGRSSHRTPPPAVPCLGTTVPRFETLGTGCKQGGACRQYVAAGAVPPLLCRACAGARGGHGGARA